MNFDTEKFIVEIQQREAIWNCEGAVYKNRDLKRKQWEELVDIFGKEKMVIEDKKRLGKELKKKWKNIRDNFVKTLRDNVTRSGSAKKKSQYIFYNNLMFLKDTVFLNEADSNMQKQENESKETKNFNDPHVAPPKRKKKNNDDMEVETINVLNKNEELISRVKNAEEDEDRLFLLSLVSEIKKVPEHLRLRTKGQIIQVITEAQTSGNNYCKGCKSVKTIKKS